MSNWYANHLNQEKGANLLKIAEAGHDNRSYYADRPKLSSTTTSTVQIMKNDAKYYPLNIQYKKQSGLSKKVQTTNIRVGYDVNQQQYVELPQALKK